MSLTEGLVSYWKCDEASSTTREDSHGPNDLAVTGTVNATTGIISNATSFANDMFSYLSVADTADLSGGDTSFTIQAWVRLADNSVNRAVLGKWILNQYEYFLYYDVTYNRFLWLVSSDGTSSNMTLVAADAVGDVVVDSWYCLHCWHDATNNVIAICGNAGSPDSAGTEAGVYDGTAAFVVGRNDDGPGNPWNGRIDEIGFWRRVLTADERSQLYNSGSGLGYSMFPSTQAAPGSVVLAGARAAIAHGNAYILH